jgi:hypothetical protein
MTFTRLRDGPPDQALIGWLGSQSIIVTLAPWAASVVPTTRAVVDFPAPATRKACDGASVARQLPKHKGEVAVITGLTTLMALGGAAMIYEMFVGEITFTAVWEGVRSILLH